MIVGVESKKVPAGNTTIDSEFLNMWCAEGLRAVKLADVQQLRFSNPVIESEFRRALDVLAQGHDAQKKAVSLHFAGDGKRKVQVGYVIEAPIWKTSIGWCSTRSRSRTFRAGRWSRTRRMRTGRA